LVSPLLVTLNSQRDDYIVGKMKNVLLILKIDERYIVEKKKRKLT
jgi:hypothetical protein